MEFKNNVTPGVKDVLMKAPEGADNVYDLPITVARVDDLGVTYVSRWQPTPEERRRIADGGDVFLYIFGGVHPPVYVSGTQPTAILNNGTTPVLRMV